jgi:hypothetical protein
MLTTSQRAIAAAEAWPLYGKPEGAGRPKSGGDGPITLKDMARLFEVSETYQRRR